MDIFKPSSAHWFGLVFLAYASLSLIWTTSNQAIYELIKLLILAQAFWIGYLLNSLKQLFEGLAIGLIVSSGLVIFGFKGGLFINPNTLSETAILVIIGCCIYRLWFGVLGISPCILMTGSRTAILTGFTIFLAWLYVKGKRFTAAYFVFIAFIVCLFLFLASYRFDSVYDRIQIWKYALSSDRYLLGYGLAEFHLNGYYNTASRAIFAHNDLIQVYFELGLIGVFLAIGFFWSVMKSEKREKYIIGAFIIVSMFNFPLHLPLSSFIAFITCGYVVRDRSVVFDRVRTC